MKKLIPTLMLAAVSCSSAFAADSSMVLNSGGATSVDKTDAGCLILASAVQVGLSANVQGALFCRQADGTSPSNILVGTCNTAGLTKSRSIQCTRQLDLVNSTAETPVYINYAPSICTEGDFPDNLDPLSVTVTGPSMFSADTSSGGGIAENNMDEACAGANVLTLITAIAN
jgi:hypothetical protein